MKKQLFIAFMALSLSLSCVYAKSGKIPKSKTIKGDLFSITMPGEFRGDYKIEKEKNKISVIHKKSKRGAYGGFAFGIKAYKNPADHAFLPGGKKVGELTDKKGRLYDIVLKYPTEIQYDQVKNAKASEKYKELYNLGESVEINGIKGSTYFKNQGAKGEGLYDEIIKKHITAINEKWNSEKLEQENISSMYNNISKTNKNTLNKVGFAYYDTNSDGIEELLIGEITDNNSKSMIYDIYNMVNRKPQHVISANNRSRFYVCNDAFICNEYSSGALENGVRVYDLLENSAQLYPQVSFKYDAYIDYKNPWFISYGVDLNQDKWNNVSLEEYILRKKIFEKYNKINFIPLSKFKF